MYICRRRAYIVNALANDVLVASLIFIFSLGR